MADCMREAWKFVRGNEAAKNSGHGDKWELARDEAELREAKKAFLEVRAFNFEPKNVVVSSSPNLLPYKVLNIPGGAPISGYGDLYKLAFGGFCKGVEVSTGNEGAVLTLSSEFWNEPVSSSPNLLPYKELNIPGDAPISGYGDKFKLAVEGFYECVEVSTDVVMWNIGVLNIPGDAPISGYGDLYGFAVEDLYEFAVEDFYEFKTLLLVSSSPNFLPYKGNGLLSCSADDSRRCIYFRRWGRVPAENDILSALVKIQHGNSSDPHSLRGILITDYYDAGIILDTAKLIAIGNASGSATAAGKGAGALGTNRWCLG